LREITGAVWPLLPRTSILRARGIMSIDVVMVVARSPLCHQAAAVADIASLDSAAHGIAAAARVVAPPVGVHGSPGCGLNLGMDLTREGNRV
jgi:hypothetical protein